VPRIVQEIRTQFLIKWRRAPKSTKVLW
jgi:hypothetical protein